MRCPFSQRQQHRVGVLLHYTLNWLRQEENQYLSCPPEAAKALSAELRALMAYTKGGYVLGICSWVLFRTDSPWQGKRISATGAFVWRKTTTKRYQRTRRLNQLERQVG